MEMMNKNRTVLRICMVCCGWLLLAFMQSCDCLKENKSSSIDGVHAPEYPLFTITPDFSICSIGDTLYKQYPRFRNGKEFPFIGILEVDGKAYRFMGGDLLRAQMIVPTSTDSGGWSGKYSFLFPGEGWEQPEYDDSRWKNGKAMFGTEDVANVHTFWSTERIYVRRTVTLNRDDIKDRKLYIRFSNDDRLTLYLNGKQVVEHWACHSNALLQIPDEVVAEMKEGENVIAARCYNYGGSGLVDFGIYAEDTTYRGIDVAQLKSVNMGATQTHYVFQCGKVELVVDFIAPLLPGRPNLLGCPINYLAYHVKTLDEQPHSVKILFDVDQESIFGKPQTKRVVDGDWNIMQTGISEQKIFADKKQTGPSWGYLYMGMKGDNISMSEHLGHIRITQEFENLTNASDVLLIGFDELSALLYFGENLPPYWKRNDNHSMEKELKKARNQYKAIKKECDRTDQEWMNKAIATGGIEFAEQHIPSYRNLMAPYRLAETPDGNPIYFAYAIGSVEEAYAVAPKLLFFERIELVKALLNPIFDYSEKGKWVKRYPARDVGKYPIASVQESEKDMPVADAANMLMMVEMIIHVEGNPEYAKQHWQQLAKWGEYLNTIVVEKVYPADTSIEMKDRQAKKALGLSAYRRLLKKVTE